MTNEDETLIDLLLTLTQSGKKNYELISQILNSGKISPDILDIVLDIVGSQRNDNDNEKSRVLFDSRGRENITVTEHGQPIRGKTKM